MLKRYANQVNTKSDVFFVIFEGQVAIKGETNLGSFAAKLFVSQIFDTLQITAVNKGTTGSVDIC